MATKIVPQSGKTLGDFPTLNYLEIDVIIELVNEAGTFRFKGSVASRENYRHIRTAYVIVLLSIAQLEGNVDKIRNSAIRKLQKVSTMQFDIAITFVTNPDDLSNFMDELNELLDEYAIPVNNFNIQILNKK